MNRTLVPLAAVLVVALWACPAPPPNFATTGELTVAITGLDGGLGAVAVAGPNGYSASPTATQTLQSLEPGSYTVTATRVILPGPVVSSVFDPVVTGSPATVTD